MQRVWRQSVKPSGARSNFSSHQRPTRRAATVRVACSAGTKFAFITGGNTGIGYETAKALCAQGYDVTLGCKDSTRALAAAASISQVIPGARIKFEKLDLASLDSVRDCARRVADSGVRYDVWLNNAGVMHCPKMATKDGFEYQLGINHLGHFALTTEMLPALKAGNKPVRIINVASAAHAFGKINFEDLMRDQSYDPWEAYGQSKLANIMFTYELAKRLGPDSRITVNCLHPGLVKTELGRYMLEENKQKWYFNLAMEGMKLMMKTPEQGAATSIYLATSPEVEGVTGKYFVDCRRTTSSNESYNTNVSYRLWAASQELTAVSKFVVSPAFTISI